MQAIVLAAGIGSRLRPITYKKPKTLIMVNDTPIICHIINALISSGINHVIIVVGYKKELVIEMVKEKYPQLNVTFITNNDFETTNNSYSLYLARNFLKQETFIMNADLMFAPEIISNMVKLQDSCFAVDRTQYLLESMKVIVKNNQVTSISKEIDKSQSYGCSIDVYKLVARDARTLYKELIRTIEKEGELNLWTEVILNELCQQGKINVRPLDIKKHKWCEIDDYNDLSVADEFFNAKLQDIKKKKIFFLDKDGTLTIGNDLIPGSVDLINKLLANNKIFYLLTNNSSKTKFEHGAEMKHFGLNLSHENILVSTDDCISYLRDKNIKDIFLLATPKVKDYFRECVFTITDKSPQRLILTYDTSLNYKGMVKFISLSSQNIPYYATHSDKLYPLKNGPIPDIGIFIDTIYKTTSIKPTKVFGKPNFDFISYTLKKHNLSHKDAVIVGDRLYTDIKMGCDNNIFSIMVLSGETSRDEYESSSIRSDVVLKSVSHLIKYLK